MHYNSYETYRYYAERRKTIAIIALSVIVIILLAASIALLYFVFNFKNDGKIGVITITGDCTVDVVDTEGISLIGDVLDFDTDEEEIYFKPSSLYYTEGFAIVNTGTMSVNFHATVSKDTETDGPAFDEAFEVWITQDVENLDSAEKLTSFTGSLDVDQSSETYYLVIKMKEEAGNEFQNQTYTGIGITVYAVQGDATVE